jgi:hypothetical protein
MHRFCLRHLFHTDAIGKDTQTVPPTSIRTTNGQIHTSTNNQEQHTNHNHLTTKEKHSKKNAKQHHGLRRRPLQGNLEDRTSKRATKDTTTSRKKCRSTKTHTRTLTRKKKEEPHQAKEQFFLNTNKDDIDFFWEDNFQRDRNLQQQQTNRATPAKRTNGGSRVKTQYRKEKHNILSTKLHDRSINKNRLGSNQTHSRG